MSTKPTSALFRDPNDRMEEVQDMINHRDISVRQLIDKHNQKGALKSSSAKARMPLRDLNVNSPLSDKSVPRLHSVDELKLRYSGTSVVIPEKELERLRQTRSWSSPSPSFRRNLKKSSPQNQPVDENRPANLPFSPLNMEQVHKLKYSTASHLNKSSYREFEDRIMSGNGEAGKQDDDDVEITFITLPVEGISNAQHVITEEVYPFSPDLKGCRGELDIECTTARSRRSSSSATQPSGRPLLPDSHRDNSESPDMTTRICGDSVNRAYEKLYDTENVPPARKLSARGGNVDRRPTL
jgi:hypothetical protein